MSEVKNLLVLPRLRVQNANAISSPMTWGFPAMSAFVGLMHALERKLYAAGINVSLGNVGVICHDFEAQATEGGYIRGFHLTRNPVDKTGGTAAIVEEGRIHLDITLIFTIDSAAAESEHDEIAKQISEIVAGMRIAGGSVIPNRAVPSHKQRPQWVALDDDEEKRQKQFERLKRRWLPGFALTLRDDYLAEHHQTLANARDAKTQFRFVESLYSIGEWVSPHRMKQPEDLLWYVDNDEEAGLYRLNNDYHLRATAQ